MFFYALICSFVARWGVLFETTKGPKSKMEEIKFDDNGKLIRNPAVLLAATRRERARDVLQLLGLSISLFKMVLFADLLAGLSKGVSPIVQVTLLLCLTTLYWVYMRVFAPPNELSDLLVEVASTACDAGTFACGIIVAVTPPSNFTLL